MGDDIRVLYRVDVLRKRGRWRTDVPLAFCMLFAIAFGTGILDEGVRELLAWPLAFCAVLAIVLAVAVWRIRKSVVSRLSVLADGRLRLETPRSTVELRGPLDVTFGRFEEEVDAGVHKRRVPVLWVRVASPDGLALAFRRAMGILDRMPADWPEASIQADDAITYSSSMLDPLRLLEALQVACRKCSMGDGEHAQGTK